MAELMNRRDWLKTAGGLVVGFTFSGLPAFGEQAAPAGPLANDGRTLDPKEVDSFLSIHPDGSVTIYTSKVDVGTGMRIAMAQMAAEELGVDTGRITVVDGDTARCPNTGGTGGSTGLTRGGTAVRQAAATARQALLGLAAARLKRPGRRPDDRRRAKCARLAGGRGVRDRRVGRRSTPCPARRRQGRRSSLRRSTRASDSLRRGPTSLRSARDAIEYIQDFTVPGMLHGRVIRPPAIGATLVSVDEASDRAASRRSRRPRRELPRRRGGGRVGSGEGLARARGDVDRVARPARARQPRALSARRRRRARPGDRATVDRPGRSATAISPARRSRRRWRRARRRWRRPTSGRVRATRRWRRRAPSQTFAATPPRSGRRRRSPTACAPRCRASSASRPRRCASSSSKGRDRTARTAPTTPRPTRCSSRRPSASRCACSGRVRTSTAGIRRARSSCSTCARVSMPPAGSWRGTRRCGFPPTAAARRILLAAQSAGIPQDSGRDAAAIFENGDPAYPADHVRVLAHWMRDTPLNPSNLRAPGKPANVFAVESFADEIAASLRVDALEFRTARLDRSPRARGADARVGGVRLAVDGRHPTRPAREGRARGARRGLHALQAGGELRRDVHGGRRRPAERQRSPCGASSAPTTAASSSTPMRCGIRSRAGSCRRSAARCTKKCSSTSRASRASTGRPIRF